MFPPIAYLEWIEGRPAAATHDLGSSDLRRSVDGVVPERLRSLSDPPADVTLEAQIGDAYGPDVGTENVLVTAGATQANVVAAATALDCGADGRANGDVLVERPAYEPLRASPRGLGAEVRSFPRDQVRYRVVPRAVADAASEHTRLVTMTNRHNPSGRLTDRDTLAAVAERVRDYDATLLVDEVYAPFESDGRTGRGTAFGGVTAAGVEDVVVTNSLTKFFGYGGLRIGWLIGPAAFVERARSTWWHLPSTAGPSRRLARRVFANRDAVAGHSRDRIRENHALLAAFVGSRDDLDGFVPTGSTMAFVSHCSALGDEVAAAALDAGVLVVPGRFFDRPEGVRLTLGRPADEMRAALDAFGDVLGSLPDGDA